MSKVRTQLIIDGKNNSKPAFDQVNKQLKDLDKSMQASGRLILQALSGAAVLRVGKSFTEQADQVKLMNAQLRLATKSQEEFATAQAELQRIAKETRSPLEAMVTLYGRISRPLQEAGRSQGEILKVTDAVAKSFLISGASATEAENGVIQFAQALGAGALRGDEFNSVAEQAPRLMQALADGIGVPVGALKEMAAQGKLTASVVTDALLGQLPKLAQEAKTIPETLEGSVTNLTNQVTLAIGTLDQLTGASSTAAGSVNRLASAMGAVSTAKTPGWMDKFLNVFKILSSPKALDGAIDLLVFGPDAKKQADREGDTYQYREALFDLHRKEMALLRAKDIADTETSQKRVIAGAEAVLKKQVALEKAAASDLETAKQAQLDTYKRYADALATINAGAAGDPSYGAAQSLKVGAREALRAGDIESAKQQAQAALKMLQDLAAAGGNTYGFEGFIKELQTIEQTADSQLLDGMQEAFDKAQAGAKYLQAELEKLKNSPVSVEMDQASLDAVKAQITRLAGERIIIPVTFDSSSQNYAHPYTLQDPGPAPQKFATGGYISGPGTGTSDSIPAYLSNGEYVINAAAVRKLGKRHLDMLNSGIPIPRFADGGMVRTVASLETSSAGASRGVVNLTLPSGETYTMLAEADQFDRLLSNTARKFGRTHRGP